MSETSSAAMLRMLTKPSGSASTGAAAMVARAGAGWMLLALPAEGAGCFTSGWVCCILIVAFGSAGLPPSGGSVIRAVSFLGEAAFCVTGSGAALIPLAAGTAGLAAPEGAAAGFSGTEGLLPSVGGFGGALMPLTGFKAPEPTGAGGFGGGGTKGLPAVEGGAGAATSGGGILVVSFFGELPGGVVIAGFPGRLMRTVSRLAVGCSGLGGNVIRIVSAFVASSVDSEGAGGISSDINICAVSYISPGFYRVNSIVPLCRFST